MKKEKDTTKNSKDLLRNLLIETSTEEGVIKKLSNNIYRKYDEDLHLRLLVHTFYKGDGISAFCSKALISKTTFFNWLKKYPKFKYVYDIVINLAEEVWINMPFRQDRKDMNFHHWWTIMKNRFGYGKVRMELPESKEPIAIIDTVLTAIENGEISPQEATQIANLANLKATIKSGMPSEENTNVREGREELKKLLAGLDRLEDERKLQEVK